jgi:hypothetical protein
MVELSEQVLQNRQGIQVFTSEDWAPLMQQKNKRVLNTQSARWLGEKIYDNLITNMP